MSRRPRTAAAGQPVRIGCGAGFAGDRIDPAEQLANSGKLDFLFFEGLAERTLAQRHDARQRDPAAGYDPLLEARFAAVLPGCHQHGTRIITNMGGANPAGAAQAVRKVARTQGLHGLRIAAVEGDDVLAALQPDMILLETGKPLSTIGKRIMGANAYLGSDGIVDALDAGGDVIITGRVADPSLVVAPLISSFGWARDDWDLLGAATVVGHLLECGAQVTGGYFADPGFKDVNDLAFLGYPYAEIVENGDAIITKLDETGGCVTPMTVKEQLLYEVHDPAAYLTPDVVADFTGVSVEQEAPDRIRVSGGRGRKRPEQLKVTIGFDGGFLAEGEISYAGAGALDRARLAIEIAERRMRKLHGIADPIRFDIIGVNSLHSSAACAASAPTDVRVRAAMRSDHRKSCEILLAEIEALWIAGPAGGAGFRGRLTPSVMTQSVLIDRNLINPRVEVIAA